MSKRVVGDGPRIVGKPLSGATGSPEWERSEALKLEIQVALKQIIESLNSAQEDIESLQDSAGSVSSQSGLHPFFLSGM